MALSLSDIASPNRSRVSAGESSQNGPVRLEALRVPRASELVADRLRALIVMGTVQTGAMLPSEKELVAQLGVSRATLREALRRLEAEGLILSRPGAKGGSIVQRPGPTSLAKPLRTLLQIEETPFSEMAEARRLIEPLCGQLAAERATEQDIAVMEEACASMRRHASEQPLFLGDQVRFHLAVVAAAHNQIIQLYNSSLAELIYDYVSKVPLTPADCLDGVRGCEAILAAIKAGDGASATRRIERHIRSVEVVVARLAQTAGV